MNLQLRSFSDEDIELLSLYANNPKIAGNLRDSFPYPYEKKHAEEYINAQKSKAIQTDFAIVYEENFAGRIALDIKDDIYRKSAEIGFWLAEPFWGKGIAPVAIKEIVQYAINHFDLTRIFAICFETNLGSRKSLERAGFELECIRKKAVFKYGQVLNDCVYVIIL
jgi:Acetyltransferases, including N-acetylases of ribosomal proteins